MTAKKVKTKSEELVCEDIFENQPRSSARLILGYADDLVGLSNNISKIAIDVLTPVMSTTGGNVSSSDNCVELTPLFQTLNDKFNQIERNLREIKNTLERVEVNY